MAGIMIRNTIRFARLETYLFSIVSNCKTLMWPSKQKFVIFVNWKSVIWPWITSCEKPIKPSTIHFLSWEAICSFLFCSSVRCLHHQLRTFYGITYYHSQSSPIHKRVASFECLWCTDSKSLVTLAWANYHFLYLFTWVFFINLVWMFGWVAVGLGAR